MAVGSSDEAIDFDRLGLVNDIKVNLITTGIVRQKDSSIQDSVHTGEDLREGDSLGTGSTVVRGGHGNGTGSDGRITGDGLSGRTVGPRIRDGRSALVKTRSRAEHGHVDRSGGLGHGESGLKILRLASGEYTN